MPPVLPDIAVRSEYNLNKYIPDENVIPTPDHTSGSISLVTENKVIFVGDTLFNVISRTVFPSFANNIPEFLKAGKS